MMRSSTLRWGVALLGSITFAACGGDDAAMDDMDMGSEAPAAAPATEPAPAADAAMDGGMMNPETATREQLLAVEGMNDAAADALIAGRPYENMLAVDAALAPHMDEAGREALYANLWKPIDPNTASEEEIMLIPRVGDNMAHEFEEYRPWVNRAHFDREIGKYVDETELARLQRYVSLPQ